MSIEQNLTELGIALPDAPQAIASYVPARQSGNLLFISGQLPLREGQVLASGAVPSAVSAEQAQQAAAQCAVNALAIVKDHLGGDWSKLLAAVRVGVFVQSDAGFDGQAKVANGASDLLQVALGEAGRHARAAVGVNALPLNAAVEAEFVFEVAS